MKGRIIKLISNQYTVLLEDGNAVSCVAIGTGKALEEIHIYSDAMDISRGKYPRFFGR